MNPESQSNSTLLGNTVDSPEEEPFVGFDKRPQSTAIDKKKLLQLCFHKWKTENQQHSLI